MDIKRSGLSYLSNSTTIINNYNYPQIISVVVLEDNITIIYKKTSNVTTLHTMVYKIIYSCKEGKWNVSQPIYGKIIPAQEEHYEF